MHVGLDHAGRTGLEALLIRARARGTTVVVAAQDDDEVERTDRTLVVDDGRVVEAAERDLVHRDVVHRTLRGPRAAEAELLDAAERLGFRPVAGDER